MHVHPLYSPLPSSQTVLQIVYLVGVRVGAAGSSGTGVSVRRSGTLRALLGGDLGLLGLNLAAVSGVVAATRLRNR